MLPIPECEAPFLDHSTKFYDAYNPEARKIYWKLINDFMFAKGADGWWMDATEPEFGNMYNDTIKTGLDNYLGSGVRYLNAYPLMATKAVYEGQRKVSSDKRVYIKTRSAWPGLQRHSATAWLAIFTPPGMYLKNK